LLGVVSKADLLDRSRLGRDKVTLTARELMTRHVVTAPPSTTGASTTGLKLSLDLEPASEVVTAGLCLVSAAEVRPVQRVLDDLCRLPGEVEQPSNLGDGQRDHAPRVSR
jgi:hypothetical protein